MTTPVTYTYNAANQIAFFTYDNNGNLTDDSGSPYTWDRANRLIGGLAGFTYKYDGLGNRIYRLDSSGHVMNFLHDLQPGLPVLLATTTGSTLIHYIHTPYGIHAEQTPAGNWLWMITDGLGTVRNALSVVRRFFWKELSRI